MPQLTRITRDPRRMGGKPCIRGMRVTVGAIVGLVAAGHSTAEILRDYPYLEAEDVAEALLYAARCVDRVSLQGRGGLFNPLATDADEWFANLDRFGDPFIPGHE